MKFENGYALIVGIANYPHITKLPQTVLKDAQDMYDVFRSSSCGYPAEHLTLLLDQEGTAEKIRNGLQWLCDKTTDEDTAVVYLSSHGGRFNQGYHPENYLIPYDCQPKRLKETAISGNELTWFFRQIRARRILILFDFCFSGGTGDPKAAQDELPEYSAGYIDPLYDALAQGRGRVIMASSRTDEKSMILPGMHNSLFTHYLLEALRGSTFSRGDGLIRVFDVFHYVSDQVKEQYPDQHPIFKAADLEDNFPVALFKQGDQTISRYQPSLGAVKAANRTNLREFIIEYFSEEDLQLLCADIQEAMTEDGIHQMVRLDIVGGTSLPAKAQNLIDFLKRRGYLGYLLECIRKSRPGISAAVF